MQSHYHILKHQKLELNNLNHIEFNNSLGYFNFKDVHVWSHVTHVTSSVTWPFDSPQAISYWWAFGTESKSSRFRDIAL